MEALSKAIGPMNVVVKAAVDLIGGVVIGIAVYRVDGTVSEYMNVGQSNTMQLNYI